jgi:hypothetical protein
LQATAQAAEDLVGALVGQALLFFQGEQEAFDLPNTDISEWGRAEGRQNVMVEVAAALAGPSPGDPLSAQESALDVVAAVPDPEILCEVFKAHHLLPNRDELSALDFLVKKLSDPCL